MRVSPLFVVLALAALPSASFAAPAPPSDFTVRVDARDVARGMLHVTQSFPANGGTLALSYPRWIPGEHGPTGPSTDMMGFVAKAGMRTLTWRRDPADMTTLRVEVPAGARNVDVTFDFALDTSTDGFTSAACSTPNLLMLSWNEVAFYPAGRKSDDLTVSASLVLPANWQHASGLEEGSGGAGAIPFQPCSFTTLVDSPVLCGRWFRTVELGKSDDAPVRLRMACDSPEGLAIKPDQVAALQNLVREAHALFGSEHFRHYDFLVSLSESIAHFGLEHHQSSDDRGRERWWLDDDLRRNHSNLLSHEYVHSWNGKFRRPAGLATGDYFTPMNGELLWIYEGLTQYLGFVLSARSGIRTPAEARDALARAAAEIESNRGRTWRPLVDTGTHAQQLYEARTAWEHWRRSTDFYDEGLLLWLEADVTIRTLTNGKHSLDDFCQAFHGGPNRGPELKPYELSDVVTTLEGIAPYDWAKFFQDRVYTTQAHAPTGGITGGGWKMAWADSLGPLQASYEVADKRVVESYTLGFELAEDGKVRDVVPGSPADVAGIAPDMKVIAVNGRRYEKDVLRDAIAESRTSGSVAILTENKLFYRTYTLTYKDGPRFPVLVRDTGKTDRVSAILAAHAH